jgi:hypothetical protein
MKLLENISSGYKRIATGIAIVTFLSILYIALIPAGSVASGVYGALSGSPIGGALVKLVDYPQYNATTDGLTGEYTMPNVPYGEYAISAQARNYTKNVSTVNLSSSSVTKDFSLYEGSVTGEYRHYGIIDNELAGNKISTALDAGKNFTVPQYGNGVAWTARVYITDYSGLGTTLTLKYYDVNGNLNATETSNIPPNGTIMLEPTDGINNKPRIGKLVIDSINNIVGEYILNSTSSTDLMSNKLYSPVDIGKSFIIPQYANGVAWQTWVSIADVSGLGANLTLEYYDVNGNLVVTETPSVPPNGLYRFTPTDGTVPARPLIGKLKITSNNNITGEYRQYSTGIGGIFASKLFTSEDMKTNFFIPQYSNGVAWHSWIAVSDVSGLGANLTLKYYDVNGNYAKTEYPSIPPNGMYRSTLTDGTPGRPLIGKLEISSNNLVAGEMRLFHTSGRGIMANSLYTQPDISRNLIVPYYGNNVNFHTFLALTDFSSYETPVRLEYHSLDGTLARTEYSTVPANGMQRWFVLEGAGGAPIEGNIFIYT